MSKFVRFKMIWSSSFEKIIQAAKFCTKVSTLVKKRRHIFFNFNYFQTNTDLGYLDILAFSGYKFVPIIAALLAGIFSKNHSLFLGIGIYGCAALCCFLVKSLKIRVQSNASAAHGQYQQGDTRRNIRHKYLF